MNTSKQYEEERLELSSFKSSEELKDAIGLRISHRTNHNWNLVNLCSQGPYICLKFELSKN